MYDPQHHDEEHRRYDADRFQPHETRKWVRRMTGVGGCCTTISMCVTFRGVYLLVGELFFPLAWALLSALISFLFFSFLCQAIPRTPPGTRGILILGVGLPVFLLVGSTSTLMGLEGAAGPEAQLLELQRVATQASGRVRELREERIAQLDSIDTLHALQMQFAQMADEEEESGRFTGSPKPGKTSRDLDALAAAFGQAATRLSSVQDRRHQAEDIAEEAAANMQAIAEQTQASPKQLPQAAEQYQQELRRFNEALATLEGSVEEREVLAPIREAVKQQALTPTSASTQAGRRRQEKAATAVSTLAQSALEQAEQALENAQRMRTYQTQPLKVPRPFAAIMNQFDQVIHLAAYPLALDFLYPLVALVALTFLRAQVREGSREQAPTQPSPSPESIFEWTKNSSRHEPHPDPDHAERVRRRAAAYRQSRARGQRPAPEAHRQAARGADLRPG